MVRQTNLLLKFMVCPTSSIGYNGLALGAVAISAFAVPSACKQLQANQLRGIYIPDEEQEFLKRLVRQRAVVSKELRSTKNGIKSLLLYQSLTIPAEDDNKNWAKPLSVGSRPLPENQLR